MASGHVKLYRSVTASPIYTKPPLYLRVFERLILEANWKDGAVVFKGEQIPVKRGERITSVRQIAEWVSWYERGILKQPNPKTIKDILMWLTSAKMISIYRSVDKSNSQVTHYSVLNYSQYQGDITDEVTPKVTVDGEVGKQSLDTNNNINNLKKGKKVFINDSSDEESIAPSPKKSTAFIPPTVDEVAEYCRERHNTVDAQQFCDHYQVRGWIPKGYTKQMKDWKAAVRTWEKNRDDAGYGRNKPTLPAGYQDTRTKDYTEGL